MSGVNWKKMYVDVEGCKDFNELEKFLISCNVEKNRVFSIIKKSLSNYGYNRDYRDKRNVSMGKLRDKIRELEGKLENK